MKQHFSGVKRVCEPHQMATWRDTKVRCSKEDSVRSRPEMKSQCVCAGTQVGLS